MTQKSLQHPEDPKRLVASKFQEFVQHFPHKPLKDAGISRTSFNSVAYSLSRHCKFSTGEDIRITQAGLVEESGCSHNTVRKVIAFLKKLEVLDVTGLQYHHGTPSETYRFRNNHYAKEVISRKDKGPKPPSTKKKRASKPKSEAVSVDSLLEPVDSLLEPVDSLLEPVDSLLEPVDNNKGIKALRAIESSVDESPSLAPIVAKPSARDGATDDSWLDDDSLKEILADL